MRIGHVEVFVRDPGRTRDFYRDVLGCEVVEEQGRVVWLKLGEQLLLLRPAGASCPAPAYKHATLAFVLYTEDLDGEMARLTGRGLVFEGADGSPRCPTFRDPDGNWFQLVNPAEQ